MYMIWNVIIIDSIKTYFEDYNFLLQAIILIKFDSKKTSELFQKYDG